MPSKSVFILLLAAATALQENDKCFNGDEESVCKMIEQCPQAETAIKSGRPPSICGFKGRSPIVCCPTSTDRRTTRPAQTTRPTSTTANPRPDRNGVTTRVEPGRIARQKCAEYAKSVYLVIPSPILLPGAPNEVLDTCVRVEEALILGGENAKPKEFPHMALIGYGEQNPRWLCGGSLISERFVISAAHCSLPGPRVGPALWARLGDLDWKKDNDDAQPITVRIVQRFDHPEYSDVTLYNDLSLFKLEKDVKLTPYIRPICLRTTEDIQDKTALASGWGHTSWGGNGSDMLKKVRLNLVTNGACNNSYQSSIGVKIPQGILQQSMLCAGDEEGKDTCQGDSGGPLQLPLEQPHCMFDLVGVTSFGKTCGNRFPGVYTRVSHYIPWIESIVWPEDSATN